MRVDTQKYALIINARTAITMMYTRIRTFLEAISKNPRGWIGKQRALLNKKKMAETSK